MRDQEDVEASYKLDGDTLTFDGGVVEVGRRGGRPAFLTVELKGEWKRVDVDLENKLRRAFPGLDVESFVIQVENRSHRLVLAANSITVQGGRVHLENCAIARIADDPAGAKPTIPTAIRCAYAAFTTDKPVRTVAELGTATITAVEFPDGVRLNLKDQ
jgi:hypothetical protein